MTACRNKAKGAVVAALVGVLSVGAVPMVAMAAGVNDGASLMASVEEQTAFAQSTVVLSSDTFTYNGGKQAPTVVSVTPRGGATISDVQTSDSYKIYYVTADAEGKPSDNKVVPVDAGTYYVVIEAVAGNYKGGKATAKFSISGKSLAGASYYEGTDVTDTTIAYTAEPADINFIVGGHKLIEGVDYTVKYYTQGQDWNDTSLGSETAPTDSNLANGNKGYYAHLTGIGAYAGTTADVKFDIDRCNLSTSDVYVPVIIGANTALPTKPETVNGSEALAAELKLVWQEDVPAGIGSFTAQVVPDTADGTDPNFRIDSTGVKHIAVDRVATGVNFTYNGEAIPETITLNTEKDNFIHDNMFGATYTDADGKAADVPASAVKKTVTDADGNVVATNINAINYLPYGTYTVTLTALDSAGHTYGGSVQFKVVVTSGTLDCATSLYVSYDGKVVSSPFEGVYNGSDYGTKFSVALYDGDDPVAAGDYAWHFEDAEGKTVTQVVSAGSYKIVVESDKYQLENATFDIVISKAEVQAIRIAPGTGNGNLQAINGRYALPYNNDGTITPAWEYTTGERDANGDLIWVSYTNPSDMVAQNSVLTVTKDGEEIKNIREVGDYVATLTATDTLFASNFSFTAEPYKFSVAEGLRFLDVPTDAWYYETVEKAAQNGYIKGYDGTKLFGPADSMTRADVVVVLYRMSGSDVSEFVDYDETNGWVTGFEDVDGKMYYAEAIAWAEHAGIVTGYEDGNFGPTDKVTREQFATMLARYADKAGNYEAVDTDAVLGEYPDGDQVSDFADDAVAWAIEEGVMGKDDTLRPVAEISRADVATMAVRYQPEKL